MPGPAGQDAVLLAFLQAIGPIRPRVERLLLFGSRARGTHQTDSDYDLLLVVDQKDPLLLDALYDAVLDVLLTYGRLVSLKVFEKQEFERLQGLRTPFMTRIAEEGVPLG
ncbi:nucleotidyltransferase domain-containing protein [Nitrospira sp. Kam-Ns4a]